jgi:hypothetical protein
VFSVLTAFFASIFDRGRLRNSQTGHDVAFHPDFSNASAPGFHNVYTYTSEPVSGAADCTVPNPNAFVN